MKAFEGHLKNQLDHAFPIDKQVYVLTDSIWSLHLSKDLNERKTRFRMFHTIMKLIKSYHIAAESVNSNNFVIFQSDFAELHYS